MLSYVCHFSRPPIYTGKSSKRGDAQITRFLPKDGDKDKAAAELEQQVGAVTVLLLKEGTMLGTNFKALPTCMSRNCGL